MLRIHRRSPHSTRVRASGHVWAVLATTSLGLAGAAGCDNGPGDAGAGAQAGTSSTVDQCGTAPASSTVVNVCSVEQTMDGFGAANTWAGPLTPAQVTLFFDPMNGIGLSLLRIGIDVNGTPLGSGAYSDAKAAAAFGVEVWGAPWSPRAADKSNNSIDNGGTLNPGASDSWASILAGFPATFKQNTGLDLYAISAQNQPDFTATYASCLFSAQQMVRARRHRRIGARRGHGLRLSEPDRRHGGGRRHQPDRVSRHLPGVRLRRQVPEPGHPVGDVGDRQPRGEDGDPGDGGKLLCHPRNADGDDLRGSVMTAGRTPADREAAEGECRPRRVILRLPRALALT